MLIPVLLAQAMVLAPDEPERVVIDLLVPAPCEDDDIQRLQGEIIVCANRQHDDRNRFTETEVGSDKGPPRAELQLGDGAMLSAETESAELGMARSQRAMVRFKLKF